MTSLLDKGIDEKTAVVFGFQILAIFSITGALILYLVFKISTPKQVPTTLTGTKPSVLITSTNNRIGQQLAEYLAAKNFRVFAGNSVLVDDNGPKRESSCNPFWNQNIIDIPLNVTREDILHEAVDLIRSHLPAGEDGLWAVINTEYDQNNVMTHWESIFRRDVMGILRLARIFSNLLRIGHGRLISISFENRLQNTFVDFHPKIVQQAANSAIQGLCDGLRYDFQKFGVKVINLSLSWNLQNADKNSSQEESNHGLPEEFLLAINESLTSTCPKNYYLVSRNQRNLFLNSLKIF